MIRTFRSAILAGALALGGCVSTHTTADETAADGAAAAPVSPPTPSTAPPPATPTEQPHQAPAVAPAHTPPPAESPPPVHAAPTGPGLGGVSVRFGIAPGDYSGAEPGVLVGEVYPGTSADLAGIRPGDRMTKWNGRVIADVESWMPLLSAAKPGDVVDVTYIRAGTEAATKVTLQARQ